MDHQNKTAIITGGSKGIGAAAVKIFAREGANVCILDLDEKNGEDLAEELGEKVIFIRCNVASESEVKAAIEKAAGHFGQVDYLVSNAGIQHYSRITETTEEEWDKVMNINLKSAFLCAKHAIPYMQKVGSGVVINVSSVQAMLSQNNVCPYVTSKTAMLGLTRSIAVDYGPEIRSVAICPGSVDTPMLQWGFAQSPDPEAVFQEAKDMHLLKRVAKPEEIGELISFVCSNRAAFITGQAIRIDGGLGVTIPGSKRN
jgi:NAD(P)-dependent dehydrogenase (short-subunit alcohol dehydrogenase family)